MSASLAPEPEPEPEPAEVGTWIDLDTLPEGASFRIGTRAMFSRGATLAVSDAGLVASELQHVGIVESRLDGKVRLVPITDCNPSVLRYVGTTLFGLCNPDRLFRWDHRGMETANTGCAWGPQPSFSPDGRRIACVATRDGESVIKVYDIATKLEEIAAGPGSQAGEIIVSDRGVVFATGATDLSAFSRGVELWRVTGVFRDIAYDATRDRVIAWNPDTLELHAFSAKNGGVVLRVPTQLDVRSPIQVAPDGASWIIASLEGVRGLVQLNASGSAVAVWPSRWHTFDAALSPNGRYAAGASGRIQRVDLRTRALAPPPTDPDGLPTQVVSTRAGDRMALSRINGTIQVFDMRAQKELFRYAGPDNASFGPVTAFSPDARRIAIATDQGELQIIEADGTNVVCSGEGVPASWLYWGSGGLVAIHRGYGEYGTITMADDACRPIKAQTYDGMLVVAREELDAVMVAVTDAEGRTKQATARMLRVDLRRRAIAPGPARLLEEMRGYDRARDMKVPVLEKMRFSRDGSTEVIVRELDANDPWTPRQVACRDAKRKTIANVHQLSATASGEITLAADGSWMAVVEEPSVLVFPCRSTPSTPPR